MSDLPDRREPPSHVPPVEFDERTVVLYPYDEVWAERYGRWEALILDACRGAVVEIHHIGSTAVPGMLAKPVIDIMPGLASFEAGSAIVDAMRALGFEARGEYGIPRRHYFRRPDVHVHAYVVGEGQWHDQLLFRDYLRAHAEAREAYGGVKRELQERFRHDRLAFSDAKSEFVASTLARAKSEAAGRTSL